MDGKAGTVGGRGGARAAREVQARARRDEGQYGIGKERLAQPWWWPF